MINSITSNHFSTELKASRIKFTNQQKSSNLNKEMGKGQIYPIYRREKPEAITR